MSNPNRCETCNHKRTPDGGWCYMFRDEPNFDCAQHTGHRRSFWLPIPTITEEVKS
jgi:hypothetical protein